jgi:hypothetical protein
MALSRFRPRLSFPEEASTVIVLVRPKSAREATYSPVLAALSAEYMKQPFRNDGRKSNLALSKAMRGSALERSVPERSEPGIDTNSWL